jgi:hypothetical protein
MSRLQTPSAVPGSPVLGRGRHRHPEAGTCLMELTALIAGEAHTDRPACVHPLLAALARVINDAVSDPARSQLITRAPSFIGTASVDPLLFDRILALVVDRALPLALPIWAPRLRRTAAQLRRRAAHGPQPLTPRRIHAAERTVVMATASLVLAPVASPDQVLVELLDDAVRLAAAAPTPVSHLTRAEHSMPAAW